MNTSQITRHTSHVVLACLVAVGISAAPRAQAKNPFLGAWNMTGTGQDANAVYWLEVKDEGGKLSGLFLNRSGHPLPLAVVKVENGELVFQGGTADKPSGPEYRAKIEGGKLVGHHSVRVGGGRGAAGQPPPPATERVVNWIGVRPPVWPRANANAPQRWDKPVVLYDAAHMKMMPNMPLDSVWGIQGGDGKLAGWHVDEDGNFANDAPGGRNLVSKQKFFNFKVQVEYKLEPKSNSGIYLRGRYELQVLDDLWDTTTERYLTQMAIYGRTAPAVLASRPAGAWQWMDATIVQNKVTVHLNGKLVHDNATIGGITGGALDNDELKPGPLMIQGDHGHVWIRKIVVTPIK